MKQQHALHILACQVGGEKPIEIKDFLTLCSFLQDWRRGREKDPKTATEMISDSYSDTAYLGPPFNVETVPVFWTTGPRLAFDDGKEHAALHLLIGNGCARTETSPHRQCCFRISPALN